ncbi:MAG: hypothetical protein AAFR61_11605 [Bacteroidota bacterium]
MSWIFLFVLLLGACNPCDRPVEVGYQDRGISLGMTYEEVIMHLPKLRPQQESRDPKRFFFSVENPVKILDQTLIPAVYVGFGPTRILDQFRIIYTLENTDYDREIWPELLNTICEEELPGLRILWYEDSKELIDPCKGVKFYLVDTTGGYDHLEYWATF